MGIGLALFGLLILIAALVWISFIKLSDFISPKTRTSRSGGAPVESGERSILGMRSVGFQYFFYALVFVIFEAMLVLVFLWAKSAKSISILVSIPMLVSLLYMVVLVRYLLKIEDKMAGAD